MALPCARCLILTWNGALVLVPFASHMRTSTFTMLCFSCMGCLQLRFVCVNMDRPAIWRIPRLAVDLAIDHHMRLVCSFCWLGCGWGVAGWLGGWCHGQQKISFECFLAWELHKTPAVSLRGLCPNFSRFVAHPGSVSVCFCYQAYRRRL